MRSARTVSILLIAAILLVTTGTATAIDPGSVCSLQIENDFFGGGTDRHFTHGMRLACLTKPIAWITDAAAGIPWFDAEEVRAMRDKGLQARAGLAMGQSIYTPENITSRKLIKEDRPYAGWLYLGFGLVANQGSNRYDKLELNIGVAGPLSLAEEVQDGWHSVLDLRRPKGWDNQLKNEPGIVLFYEQARRFGKGDLFYGLDYDVIPHIGGAVGNVFTFGAAGLTIRVGPALHEDFGPPRIRPSLPGAGYFVGKQGISWYLFAGAEGRSVLHNIFLDGNTFRESHSVKRRVWVGDLQAGLALKILRARITYTQVMRSKEYEGQDRADSFGSLSLSYQF